MNSVLLPMGGVLTGRIEWPVDATLLALTLIAAFVLLGIALTREMRGPRPASTLRVQGTPRLSGRWQQQQAA